MKIKINNIKVLEEEFKNKEKRIKNLKNFKFKEIYDKVVEENKKEYYKKDIKEELIEKAKRYLNDNKNNKE